MVKIAVVYKSKYGSTERYAGWIAEDVTADIYKASQVNIDVLKIYDIIVYCGGLYAGGILGFSLIKNNIDKLADKKIIVAAVGASFEKDEVINEIKNRNFTNKMKNTIPLFLLRGALNYKKMNLLDRFLMYLFIKSLKAKKENELDSDSKNIIASYNKIVDFTDRNSIKPIVEIIKA